MNFKNRDILVNCENLVNWKNWENGEKGVKFMNSGVSQTLGPKNNNKNKNFTNLLLTGFKNVSR